MNKIIIISITLLFSFTATQAQEAGDFMVGIKAGLNFASILGPKEKDSAGGNVESGAAITRFHLGPTFKYAITDKNGLMLEVLYSQKGEKYVYDGEAYYLLSQQGFNSTFLFEGDRTESININNGYLDVPLMFYYKATGSISLYGGGYVGFLLNSTGSGQLTFDADEKKFNGVQTNLLPIRTELDHNYGTDEAGVSNENSISSPVFNQSIAGGVEQFGSFTYPSVTGAYTDFDTKDGNFYNSLDAGVVAGVEFRFDTGLVFGLRGTYGLMDVTNNFYDYSKVAPTDGAIGDYSPVSREDKDVNFNIQLQIGFEF